MKPKVVVLVCLVSLLVMVIPFSACGSKEKTLSDLAIKIEWVDPIAIAAKPYDAPKSLGNEYTTYHVILGIDNPNDFLVTVDWLEATAYANQLRTGLVQIDSAIYIPPGKKALVRMPITLNTLKSVQELVVGRQMSAGDATKLVLDTWQALQDGKAICRLVGAARVVADTTTRHQNFDIRWR